MQGDKIPNMVFRRIAMLVLGVVVVSQGLAAAVPHRHGPEGPSVGPVPASDQASLVSGVDSPRSCLACAIHAPVMEPSVTGQFDSSVTVRGCLLVAVAPECDLSTLGSASPRGPPRGV